MLNRKVRNLAVTAITIGSTTALLTLGATGASAATKPICSAGAPRACIQVLGGTGGEVAPANAWMWNNTSNAFPQMHIEIYNQATSGPPSPSDTHENCGVGTVAPHSNSRVCGPLYYIFPTPSYLCSAAWQLDGNGGYSDRAWVCVFLH